MNQVLQNLKGSEETTVGKKHYADSLLPILEKNRDEIQMALGSRYDVGRYIRCLLTYMRGIEWLGEVNRASLNMALMRMAQHGLNPLLDEAYLVKYKRKDSPQPVAECMISYIGLIKIIVENTDCLGVYAEAIKKRDRYRIIMGTSRRIDHEILDPNNRGETICYYAVAQYPNHAEMEVMSLQEIEKARKCAKDDSIWSKWYEEQAKKTVIRRLIKRLPKGSLLELDDDNDVIIQPQSANSSTTPSTPDVVVTAAAPTEDVTNN